LRKTHTTSRSILVSIKAILAKLLNGFGDFKKRFLCRKYKTVTVLGQAGLFSDPLTRIHCPEYFSILPDERKEVSLGDEPSK
jgi:hypothetical protein